jgi:hypothetical protein
MREIEAEGTRYIYFTEADGAPGPSVMGAAGGGPGSVR